jgi:copper chaperone CopZ
MEGETVEHVRVTSSKIDGDDDRARVETDLGVLHGVRSVKVDPESHSAEIAFDPLETSLPKIQEALQAGGYDAQQVEYGASRDDTAFDESTS